MNLAEFCRSRRIDLHSVVSSVEASVGLCPDDTLLAVGSLVEGIGNSKSDLDLILITGRPETQLPARDEVALIVGACVVDMRILRTTEVGDLLVRIERWSRLPWDVTHTAGFGIEERTLLHRLCHGHRLSPTHLADEPFLPRVEDMARLKLHAARHVSRSIQVDLEGYVEDRQYGALVFAAQELLGHAVDALLAGYGLTNPLPKWRTKLLSSLPADWEASLTVRPSGLSAAERVWELHRAPDFPVSDLCVEHALRISSVARAAFVWAERRLWRIHDRRLAWVAIEEEGARGRALPRLDLDVDFLLSEEGATLGRLNSFGETVTLGVGEFDVALLCDGVTTPAEAEAIALRDRGEGGHLAVEGLVGQLAAAGLLRESRPGS